MTTKYRKGQRVTVRLGDGKTEGARIVSYVSDMHVEGYYVIDWDSGGSNAVHQSGFSPVSK